MAGEVASPRRAGPPEAGHRRVLIYSHDTFGLGHIRRARAIANALVEGRDGVSVLVVSGSPVIGRFAFAPGVDFVRVPGVAKEADGGYRSLALALDLDEAVALREALIRQAAEAFRPDLLLVDKEPTGFRGEVLPTLELLRRAGCRTVLGLRDVLDDAELLLPEWRRKGALPALDLYDEIWVYGLPDMHEPLAALPLDDAVRRRVRYTGYIRRGLPEPSALRQEPDMARGPFLLVTTGGGGDGGELVDWVIRAYEADPGLPLPALVVFGPFIGPEQRRQFLERITRHPKLDALAFDAELELLMARAAGVVAMGGYNTFCEILSFDRPALVVPRTRPRLEQLIRARAAERLGLVRVLLDEGGRDPLRMAAALRALPGQARPSERVIPGLLDGLDGVRSRFDRPVSALHHAAE